MRGMSTTQSPIIKIFAGFRLSPDLKEAVRGEKSHLTAELQIIPHQGREYIGIYLESATPTVQEIKDVHEKIHTLIQAIFFDLRFCTPSFVVFPQLFLG